MNRPSPSLEFSTHTRNLVRGGITGAVAGALVGEAADRLPRGSGGRAAMLAVATGMNAAATAEFAGLTWGFAAATFGTAPAISPAPGTALTSLAFAATMGSLAETVQTAEMTADALNDMAAACEVPGGGTP